MTLKPQLLLALLATAFSVSGGALYGQQIIVNPSRGGGMESNAPMIHCDVFYNYASNKMELTLDTSKGVPKLMPLPYDYAFNPSTNYAVLNGKFYNFQFAWNPGGLFTNPPGAAVWIECIGSSPGLEVYDGPGNKMLMKPRTYAPIFGTAGSSPKWQWYGAMAHNSYAIANPTNRAVWAQYRVYFGDALTGSRDGYTEFADGTVTLTWAVDLPTARCLHFGAVSTNTGGPLCLVEAGQYTTNCGTVFNFNPTNSGPCSGRYECPIDLVAISASDVNAGTNGVLPGTQVALELVGLTGSHGGSLDIYKGGQMELSVPANGSVMDKRIVLPDTEAGEKPRWALSAPGLYCLSFRVVDVSTNGFDGGAVHTPSPVYCVYFQAGHTIGALEKKNGIVTASFGGEPCKTYYLEKSQSLGGSAGWQSVAGPLAGTTRMLKLTNSASTTGSEFYRLRVTTP